MLIFVAVHASIPYWWCGDSFVQRLTKQFSFFLWTWFVILTFIVQCLHALFNCQFTRSIKARRAYVLSVMCTRAEIIAKPSSGAKRIKIRRRQKGPTLYT